MKLLVLESYIRKWGTASAHCGARMIETPFLVDLSVLRPYEEVVVTAFSPKHAFISGGHPGLAMARFTALKLEVSKEGNLKFPFFEMGCLVVVQLSWPRVPSRYKCLFWSWSNCLLELFKSVRLETPRFTDLPRVLPWRIRLSDALVAI